MALTKHDTKQSTVLLAGGGEITKSSISMDNISHIIQRLTELYPKPVEAAIREVISNAVDAVNELPFEDRRPIEVSSPNSFSPYFVVEDHGCGMSPDDVKKIYANYGVSTKKDNLEAVGSYGLGGKAPLAYTDHFDVVTTKDGITTSFSMQKVAGEVEIETHSIERLGLESGTKITIPVISTDVHLFKQAIDVYRHHSWVSAINIDGVQHFENPNYEFFGNVTIYSDDDTQLEGRLHVLRRGLHTYFNQLKDASFSHSSIHYALGGWVYSASGGTEARLDPTYVVEIVPALVNFASARDSITSNENLHRLNGLVVEQLKSNAALVTRAFEIFRDFSHEEIRHFDKELLSSAIKLYEGEITVGKSGWGYPKPFTGPLSLMDNKNGINPFTLRAADEVNNLKFGLAWGKDSKLEEVTTSTSYTTIFGSSMSKNPVGKIGNLIASFSEGDRLSLKDVALAFYGQDKKIVIVTDTVEDQLKALIRARVALFAGERETTIYFISGQMENRISKIAKSNIKAFLGDSISYKTAAALLVEIAADRKAILKERKSGRTEAQERELNINTIFVQPPVKNWKNIEEVEAANAWRGHHNTPVPFSQLIADPNTVIIFSSDWKSVYRGAINDGQKIVGKQIYVFEGKKISHTVATALQEISDRVYFGRGFDTRLKSVASLAEGRSFSSSVLLAKRSGATDEQIAISLIGPRLSVLNAKAVTLLSQRVPEDQLALKNIFNLYAQYKAKTLMPSFNERDALEEATIRGMSIVTELDKFTAILDQLMHTHTAESELHKNILGSAYNPGRRELNELGPVIEFMLDRTAGLLVAALAR